MFESQLRDLLGREPELVRVLTPVLPTIGDWVCRDERLFVVRVEPDRRGIEVVQRDGKSRVSLHPSEYEVLRWRDPINEEISPSRVPSEVL